MPQTTSQNPEIAEDRAALEALEGCAARSIAGAAEAFLRLPLQVAEMRAMLRHALAGHSDVLPEPLQRELLVAVGALEVIRTALTFISTAPWLQAVAEVSFKDDEEAAPNVEEQTEQAFRLPLSHWDQDKVAVKIASVSREDLERLLGSDGSVLLDLLKQAMAT